uniref:Late embryogenesis abundant protein LEA-2 subgroup domain-containing protein n=1 Tax=Davidia involucrata TaxID=16924 RepID=A0A5B7C4U2_DAVIN
MSRQRETNPHFLPRQQHPQPKQGPNLHFPAQPPPPPPPPQPQPQHSTSLTLPPRRKTKPITWFIAVFCALFWIIIIVGGLIVLIVYLVFRPRSPKFDLASATLNAAYLDMGHLLNADLTLQANFTNPNKKVKVDFSNIIVDLYHENTLIATGYVNPFSAVNPESKFMNVHMVSSQVPLSVAHSQQLKSQMNSNRVRFEVKGLFRTRSDLGSFLRYSYWLYGHCSIVVTGPPGGSLVSKKCRTKR